MVSIFRVVREAKAMNIDPKTHPQWAPLLSQDEGFLNQMLAQLRPAVVFDIGTNKGEMVEKWWGNGAHFIHCFEPVPELFNECTARFMENPGIIVHRLGISDKRETVQGLSLFSAWSLAPKGSRQDEHPDYVGKPPFTVNFIALDDIDTIPNFIKLDVDGYEFRALRGMKRLMQVARPPILFEFSHVPNFIFGEDVAEMCRFIYDQGYRAFSLDGWECPSAEDMMKYYPVGSSYDILLLPK